MLLMPIVASADFTAVTFKTTDGQDVTASLDGLTITFTDTELVAESASGIYHIMLTDLLSMEYTNDTPTEPGQVDPEPDPDPEEPGEIDPVDPYPEPDPEPEPDPIQPDPVEPDNPDPIDPDNPDNPDPVEPDPVEPDNPDNHDPVEPDPIEPDDPDVSVNQMTFEGEVSVFSAEGYFLGTFKNIGIATEKLPSGLYFINGLKTLVR